MFKDYFIVNGVRCYTGTVFIIRSGLGEEEASFICYDTDKDIYIYRRNGCMCRTPSKLFWKFFVAMTSKQDKKVHMPEQKVLKDRHIDGLPLGWLWYIFFIAIATIFKGNVVLWILISIVFFGWRRNKIKEEGTYIEW